MKKSKAITLANEIEQLRYNTDNPVCTTTLQDTADDSKTLNYEIIVYPRSTELTTPTADDSPTTDAKNTNNDSKHEPTPSSSPFPSEINDLIQTEYPDVTVETTVGTPTRKIDSDIIYWVVNDGMSYRAETLYDYMTELGWEFTPKLETLAKTLEKPKLDRYLNGAWKYTPTPPHSRVFHQTSTFRAVEKYPHTDRSEGIHNIFSPTNIIEFIRIPNSIADSARLSRGSIASISYMNNPSAIWSGNVNYVTITTGQIRDETPHHEKAPSYPDEGYYISGGFVEPTITTDIDKFKDKLYESLHRTNTAIELNTQIEQIWAKISLPNEWDSKWENISNYKLENELSLSDIEITATDSGTIPIRSIHGVGKKTIARVAKQFGTYHSLADADPEEINQTNNFYNINEEKLISTAKLAVRTHNIWQQYQESATTKEQISELQSFPKEHPRLSVINNDAGRPERDPMRI